MAKSKKTKLKPTANTTRKGTQYTKRTPSSGKLFLRVKEKYCYISRALFRLPKMPRAAYLAERGKDVYLILADDILTLIDYPPMKVTISSGNRYFKNAYTLEEGKYMMELDFSNAEKGVRSYKLVKVEDNLKKK